MSLWAVFSLVVKLITFGARCPWFLFLIFMFPVSRLPTAVAFSWNFIFWTTQRGLSDSSSNQQLSSLLLLLLFLFSLPDLSFFFVVPIVRLKRQSSVLGPSASFCNFFLISGADWVMNWSLSLNFPSWEPGSTFACLIRTSMSHSRKTVGFSKGP